jgi:hypothetical protein
VSSSISATIINYGDASATTYMVTFAYTLTCTATTARLIVSKPDSSSSYNKIEHHDLDVSKTTHVLELDAKLIIFLLPG